LNRVRLFFRWLYNAKGKEANEKYNLDKVAANEADFVLGMLINQMSHRFLFSIIEHNLEVTAKDKEYFYEQVFKNLEGLKRGIRWILEK
jgi:hypothetical protein